MAKNLTYDELYDQGFDDLNIDNLGPIEEEVEEEQQEEEYNADTENEEEENPEEDTNEDDEEVEQPETENEDIDTSKDEQDNPDEEDIKTEETDSNEEPKGRKIRWNKQEIFIKEDEINDFIQKGFDYSKKTIDLRDRRQLLELFDENKLTQEDLLTFAAAKNGDTDALGKIVGDSNVDLYDINENSDYKPEAIPARNYELEDVIESIKSDTEYSESMDRYISSVPQTTKNLFIENPKVLQGLYEDEKNGVAQKVMPEVIKALVMNPNADFLQTYASVGQKLYDNTDKKEKVKEKPEAKRATKKKASLSKKNNSTISAHEDVWEDDELFEKMMKMTDPMYKG